MLEPHVPEDLTSYIVEAYVALRAESGQDAKNGDQVYTVCCGGGQPTGIVSKVKGGPSCRLLYC